MSTVEIVSDNRTGINLGVPPEIGTLVLGSLMHHPEMGLPASDNVDMRLLGVGTRNIAVHVSLGCDASYREVVCRTPMKPDTFGALGLYHEYGVLNNLPGGVAPAPYYLDTARPDSPILVQEYIAGRTIPYPEWDGPTVLAFAGSLGTIHNVTATKKRSVALDEYLMRHPIGERLRITPLGGQAERLCREVLGNTISHLQKVQSLFDRAQHALVHNDLDSPGNILVPGSPESAGPPRVIDFEHAGGGDPGLEVAGVYNPDVAFSVDGRQVCLALGAEQELAFLKAYSEATGREDPTLHDRVRVGQLIRLARLVVGHTALIDANRTKAFGMTPEVAANERDHAHELYRTAAASL